MVLEVVGQLLQVAVVMIVADGGARCFPDLLLWVEVWRRRGQIEDLEAWMRLQQLADGVASMPGCSVPEEQDGLLGVCCQQAHQEEDGCLCIHELGAQRCFLSRYQVQGSVEMCGLTSRMEFACRWLSTCMPNHPQRRLQIE